MEASQARLRICLLINGLLKLMGEDASIDDELYQKIYDNMLERLKDKNDDIRGQAVTALQRLQVRSILPSAKCKYKLPITYRSVVRNIYVSI